MDNNISFRFSSPLSQKDAKRLKLDQSLSALTVSWPISVEREVLCFEVARTITLLIKPTETLHVQPIRSFIELDQYTEALDATNLAYWFDSLYEKGSRKRPAYLTIECQTENDIAKTLQILDSEEVVLYPSTSGARYTYLEEKYPRCEPYRYEIAFMPKVKETGLLIEFLPSHSALDIFGTRRRLISGFCELVPKLEE